MKGFRIEEIAGRTVCIGGIGKMFYEEGFPISIAVEYLRREDVEVSIFHIADECMKNGWSADTAYRKLREELSDGGIDFKQDELYRFCHACYEDQREMIFEFLFKDRSAAKEWLVGVAKQTKN